jgi:hypothetical protein
MGIFTSFRKSWRVRKLQLAIASPDLSFSLERNEKRDKALGDFLDLCESDEGIKQIMARFSVNRSDLLNAYQDLLKAGLGQWINGHYAALSSIAYGEPLFYYLTMKKRGIGLLEIAAELLSYWDGTTQPGALFRAASEQQA